MSHTKSLFKNHLFNSNKSLSILLISFLVLGAFIGLIQIPTAKATDSTFGKTTAGAQVTGDSNWIYGTEYTLSETGEASSITASCAGPAGASYQTAIYDSGGNLVVASEVKAASSESQHWETFSITPTTLSAGTYYLAGMGSGAWFAFYMDYNSPLNGISNSRSFASGFPATLSVPTQTDKEYSIYVTYTAIAPTALGTLTYNSTLAGNTTALAILGTSTYGLQGYIFGSNVSGTFTNSSYTLLSGNPTSVTINASVLMPSAGSKVQVRFWANDTADNWDSCPLTTLTSYTLNGAYVLGNHLYYPNGTVFVPKGMGYTYFVAAEGAPNGTWMLPDGSTLYGVWSETGVNNTLDFLKASNATLCRVFMTCEYWISNTNNYQDHIKYFITQAANRDIYTQLTFWNANATGSMPNNALPWEDNNGIITNEADFIDLWQDVTTTLKDYPTVLFELWNEPNGGSGVVVWFDVTQQCITMIRDTVGASQLIVIQWYYQIHRDLSTSWTVGMDWVFDYPLNDPLGNLIYSTHIYNTASSGFYNRTSYVDINTILTDCDVYNVAAIHPVIIGEIGCSNYDLVNQLVYYNNTLTLLDEHGIGYCGFAGPPWNSGMQWGLVQFGIANYTLDEAGVVLIEHMGGMNYSQWLQSLIGSSPTNEPNSINFNFKDLSNNAVNNAGVTWQIYNGSTPVTYTLGALTLSNGSYTVKTSYMGYLINTTSFDTISYSNATINIYLNMRQGTYFTIAANNTVTTLTINSENSTYVDFNTTGSSGPYMILVPGNNNASIFKKDSVTQTYGSNWTYDATRKVVVITAASLSGS
jgi:hypothetical protein